LTSVTVAGGSFDVPERSKAKVRVVSRASTQPPKWLQYGIGVSIAGLLAANGLTLASMLGGETAGDADRGTVSAASAAGSTSSSAAVDFGGEGFASFDIPADLADHALASFGAGTPANAAPSPASTESPAMGALPAVAVPAPTAPRVGSSPASTLPARSGIPSSNDGAIAPAPPTPVTSLLEPVTSVVAEVPVIGPTAAEVVTQVVAPVESAVAPVVTPVVDAVTAPTSSSTGTTTGVTNVGDTTSTALRP